MDRRQLPDRRQQGWKGHVTRDIAILTLSILVAVLLVRTGALVGLLNATGGMGAAGAFIAGMFFTSLFTTAPAIATLGEIALVQGVFATALFGAFGSVLGDLLIYHLIRDRFSAHLSEIVVHRSVWRRFRILCRRRLFRWMTFFAGGIILASPLPDELGITVLGLSKVGAQYFVILSYIFNFLGILAIGLLARSLVG